jgi:hypothetical protein
MAKKTIVKIALQVTERREHGFYHCHARPVIIGPTLWEMRYADQQKEPHNVPADRIRGFGQDDEGTALYLEHFMITSQGDEQPNTERRLYGWEMEYREVFSVTAYRAERMAKTLDTITRRMQKTAQTFGAPSTFGSYLARVADGIGASAIILPSTRPTFGSTDRVFSLADGVYSVDRMIERWTTNAPERESAAS